MPARLTSRPPPAQFFPGMRERLQARGHKTADYDICL